MGEGLTIQSSHHSSRLYTSFCEASNEEAPGTRTTVLCILNWHRNSCGAHINEVEEKNMLESLRLEAHVLPLKAGSVIRERFSSAAPAVLKQTMTGLE